MRHRFLHDRHHAPALACRIRQAAVSAPAFRRCSSPSCSSSPCVPVRSPSGSARSSALPVLLCRADARGAARARRRSPRSSLEAYQTTFFPALIEGLARWTPLPASPSASMVIDVIRAAWAWTMTMPLPRMCCSSGLLTGALMALIYVVSIVVGAQSRALRRLSENSSIAHANRRTLPRQRGTVYSCFHHHLCLPSQDLHRSGHCLRETFSKMSEREDLLPQLRRSCFTVFHLRWRSGDATRREAP